MTGLSSFRVIPYGHWCVAAARNKSVEPKMPGNDITVTAPVSSWAQDVRIDEARLAAARSICRSPWSRCRRPIRLWFRRRHGEVSVVVNGVGGVVGTPPRSRSAVGGVVVAIDVSDDKLAAVAVRVQAWS
jgi:hypothetical protein